MIPPDRIEAAVAIGLALCASAIPGSCEARQDTGDEPLALIGARVVPLEDDTVLVDRTLILRDGRIEAMGHADSVAIPPDSRRLELDGRWVLPGLIDGHVHLREPAEGLVLFPAAGVTTVVNLEGEPGHLSLRDSILSSGLLAPRILSSGPFLDEIVENAGEARLEVDRQRRAGYDLLKIHGEMDEAAFRAATDRAREMGLPVVAHHPENLPVLGVLDRLDALAHLEEVLGSSLIESPGDLAPDSIASVAEAIVSSSTAVITTLGFFTGMRDQATDEFYRMIGRPELAYVSPERRRAWLYDGHREYIGPADIPWYDAAVEVLHRLAGAIQSAGGTLIAGTDTPLEYTVPGVSLVRELDELAASGLEPYEALRAATVAPADLLERPDLGRIREGASADLLIVSGDPTESLAALRNIHGVVLRGRFVSRAELDRSLDALAAAYARREIPIAARRRVAREIADLVRREGVPAAVEELRRLRTVESSVALDEGDINDLGYGFLAAGDVDTAVEIFRLNVELHPGSGNARDSLGEAYLERGDLDRAERAYRRALELDPTLDSARRALEEIEQRRP
ncbi:MAG: amidohydrolase family protein [Gemmatimonadota bacterium]|nr:amidohydrolase family protein [Gemmatimonadota bacterium]